MLVIPAINCPDAACVAERLAVVRSLGAPWVQFDVSDGSFGNFVSWRDPMALEREPLLSLMEGVSFEAHLMVLHPHEEAEAWLQAGASRIIFHVESAYDLGALERLTRAYDANLMAALRPDTPIAVLRTLPGVGEVQLLAVSPGPSGQSFAKETVRRVRELSALRPDVTIEVDGGITPDTARAVATAGAELVAAGSYIFESENPHEAYEELHGTAD